LPYSCPGSKLGRGAAVAGRFPLTQCLTLEAQWAPPLCTPRMFFWELIAPSNPNHLRVEW
jgi:hypothetical protein